MKYYINIITGALCADYIAPQATAYWRQVSKAEYEQAFEAYYGFKYTE